MVCKCNCLKPQRHLEKKLSIESPCVTLNCDATLEAVEIVICEVEETSGLGIEVPCPLDSLGLGEIAQSTSVETTNGLKITNLAGDGAPSPAGTGGPWNVILGNDVGVTDCEKVVKCGIDEATPVGDPSLTSPFRSTNSTTSITLGANAPVDSVASFDLHVGFSTEADYDFLIVSKNGNQIASFSGDVGLGSYLTRVIPGVTITESDEITIRYSKDGALWRGSDTIYFYAKNLRIVKIPVPAKIEVIRDSVVVFTLTDFTDPIGSVSVGDAFRFAKRFDYKYGDQICLTADEDVFSKFSVKLTINRRIADCIYEDQAIKGDLCVSGKIKNVKLELEKYCIPPSSEDVFDQMLNPLQGLISQNFFTEDVVRVEYPIASRLPGVYGYSETNVGPLTEFPFSAAPDGTIAEGDSVVVGTLKVTNVIGSSVDPGFPATVDGPWYVESGSNVNAPDGNLTKVFTGGIREDYTISTNVSPESPRGTTRTRATFKIDTGASNRAIFDLAVGVSSEGGIWDFLEVRKNGTLIFTDGGPGPIADPYKHSTIPALVISTADEYEVTFIKDFGWYSGVDSIYFYVKNLQYTTLGFDPTGTQLYPAFAKSSWQVDSPNPALLSSGIKNTFIVDGLPGISEWFTERGFPVVAPDSSVQDERAFNFYNRGSGGRTVNMSMVPRFTTGGIPTHIDLAISGDSTILRPGAQGILASYAPFNEDPDRDQRFLYPFQIPLTQDIDEYCSKVESGDPIVLYEDIPKTLTFSVNNINHLTYSNDQEKTLSNPLDKLETTLATSTMKAFNGKFVLLRRTLAPRNELIRSDFRRADLLSQVSETVQFENAFFVEKSFPQNEIASITFNRQNNSGIYVGMVAPRMGGGSPAMNIKLFDTSALNAFAQGRAPWITLTTDVGDNINTLPIEIASGVGTVQINGNPLWFTTVVKLTEAYLASPGIPEDVGTAPAATVPPDSELLAFVVAHEIMHVIGLSSGYNLALADGEGRASGVEYSPSMNNGTYWNFRAGVERQFISRHCRGGLSISESPGTGVAREGPTGESNTYGLAFFWVWLSQTYDPGYQVMRRSEELLSLQTSQFPLDDIPRSCVSGAASKLSMKQALVELYSLDIAEVYKNFAISLSLIRNNSSIGAVNPAYTTKWPYWIHSTAYPDYQKVSGNPFIQTWWEDIDNNTASSIVPQLLSTDGTQVGNLIDLSSFIYVVDPTIAKVKVTNNLTVNHGAGRIAVTMHKYDKTTSAGALDIQGPFELTTDGASHEFTLASLTGTGLIRLVVSNLEVTDFGGGLTGEPNIFLPDDISFLDTAKVTIDLTL